MRRERLQSLRNPILGLYIVSFVLPIARSLFPGVFAFLLSFIYGFIAPGLLFVWSANVLFWIGLNDLGAGRYRRSASFGLASLLASSPSILFVEGVIAEELAAGGLLVLPWFSGYFAWVGSMARSPWSVGWPRGWTRVAVSARVSASEL